jgi:hypothetical protein
MTILAAAASYLAFHFLLISTRSSSIARIMTIKRDRREKKRTWGIDGSIGSDLRGRTKEVEIVGILVA